MVESPYATPTPGSRTFANAGALTLGWMAAIDTLRAEAQTCFAAGEQLDRADYGSESLGELRLARSYSDAAAELESVGRKLGIVPARLDPPTTIESRRPLAVVRDEVRPLGEQLVSPMVARLEREQTWRSLRLPLAVLGTLVAGVVIFWACGVGR